MTLDGAHFHVMRLKEVHFFFLFKRMNCYVTKLVEDKGDCPIPALGVEPEA